MLFYLVSAGWLAAPGLQAQNISLTRGGNSLYQDLSWPQNLYVQDRLFTARIGILQGGYLSYTPQPAGSVSQHLDRLYDTRYWRNTGLESELLTPAGRETILRDHFGSNSTARFFNQAEMNWIDIRWHGNRRSYALSLKTRYASRFEIGRGLFSLEGAQNGDYSAINRSFYQKSQVFHELSFTTAEPLTYLSGMLSDLSQFVVGITPKFLIAAGYTEVYADEQIHYDQLAHHWSSTFQFNQRASGYMAEFANDIAVGRYVPGLTRRNLLNPAGYGFGVDAGISYIVTLGDDLSLLNRGKEATRKALRFNFSLTDIGALFYTGETFGANLDPTVTILLEEPEVADRTFYGAPAEYNHFLEPLGLHRMEDQVELGVDEPKSVFLPSAAHLGIDFLYNVISLSGSAHYTFQDQAFSTSGFGVNSTIEVRPFSPLSIHAGTGFGQDQPGYYSGGARLMTRWFELNATAVLLRTRGSGSHLFAGAMGGLSIYLN